MKKLVVLGLENHSTKDVFLFRIACSICGTEYGNKPVRFSKANIVPSSETKKIIYNAVYEQEYNAARQSAVRVAAEHMNYCPICKQLVCNRCFLICEDLDMCKKCAAKLNESGSPVLSDMLEAIV